MMLCISRGIIVRRMETRITRGLNAISLRGGDMKRECPRLKKDGGTVSVVIARRMMML